MDRQILPMRRSNSTSALLAPLLVYICRVGAGFGSILLEACCSQCRCSAVIKEPLPGQKFLDCEAVSFAGFFERENTRSHRRDDGSLAATDPSDRARRRQALNRAANAGAVSWVGKIGFVWAGHHGFQHGQSVLLM